MLLREIREIRKRSGSWLKTRKPVNAASCYTNYETFRTSISNRILESRKPLENSPLENRSSSPSFHFDENRSCLPLHFPRPQNPSLPRNRKIDITDNPLKMLHPGILNFRLRCAFPRCLHATRSFSTPFPSRSISSWIYRIVSQKKENRCKWSENDRTRERRVMHRISKFLYSERISVPRMEQASGINNPREEWRSKKISFFLLRVDKISQTWNIANYSKNLGEE